MGAGPALQRFTRSGADLEEVLLHQLERSSLVLPGADRDELASALRALDARVRDALG